jgi:MoaA/NifB/PqqE/SkfB family radical SAM enzyme
MYLKVLMSTRDGSSTGPEAPYLVVRHAAGPSCDAAPVAVRDDLDADLKARARIQYPSSLRFDRPCPLSYPHTLPSWRHEWRERMRDIKRPSRSRVEMDIFFSQSVRFIRVGGLGRAWRFRRAVWNGLASSFRRRRIRRRGSPAPVAIAISPTMRCNLSCAGCYAADYPREGEMTLKSIDGLLDSAEGLGVFTVVVTGGEPLLREGLLDLLIGHRRLAFLLITNGTLVEEDTARKIARSGNVVATVSVEGFREHTDGRRGAGAHDAALRAMDLLKEYGGVFGFSTTVTRSNWKTLSGGRFTDEMIQRGCTLGFHTEYVPIGSGADMADVLTDDERAEFRRRVLGLRRTRPLLLMHLPDDEYSVDGRCQGVAGGSVHINSQGFAEPCPFCHYASDSISDKSLEDIISSPFLAALRSSDAILRRTCIGCALVENAHMVKEIGARTGARSTDCPH